jgi:hypothetical protein
MKDEIIVADKCKEILTKQILNLYMWVSMIDRSKLKYNFFSSKMQDRYLSRNKEIIKVSNYRFKP